MSLRKLLTVWLAVYPAATLVQWVLTPLTLDWPLPLRTLLFTLVLVPLMVGVAVPALERLLGDRARRVALRNSLQGVSSTNTSVCLPKDPR